MLKFIIILSLVFVSSNSLGQNIKGYYVSNVAELGFFVTRVQLNSDLTFKYELSGDLQYDHGKGTYELINSVVHLCFDPIEDTNQILRAIREVQVGSRPKKFLYRSNKLWSIHIENGKVVRKGQAFSRRRKFLFFGERYMTRRRIYLKKQPDKELIWRFEKPAAKRVTRTGSK